MDSDWHYLRIIGDRLVALSLYVDGELSSKNTSFAELNLDTNDNYVIGAGSSISVSYTHLDVYKRQDQMMVKYGQNFQVEKI